MTSWQIVLTDVQAVGAGSQGQIRAIIDDQDRADVPASAPEPLRERQQLRERQGLLAQLHQAAAPREDRLEQVRQVAASGDRSVEDRVER